MPIPEATRKLEKPLMRDEVYEDLREWIIGGTLKPGEKLRDAELAEALGVSRMPVREALRRLEDEGLVETAANRWTRVASVDLGQAERIYPIIIALESLAVKLAVPHLDEQALRRMEEANARLRDALRAGEAVQASLEDRNFHEVLLENTGNPDLTRILENLKMKLRRLEVAYFGGSIVAERSVEEHEELLAALRAGEVERASRAVEDNWHRSLQRVLEQLGNETPPADEES
jgi:DNA-binding GntR family transcriptional regulator